MDIYLTQYVADFLRLATWVGHETAWLILLINSWGSYHWIWALI